MKSFITYLTEKKDHIIKRLKNLTDDEKDQVIAFFNKKPNLENKIDWQNRNLTFKDFEHVMDTTKTERRRAVKKHGIAGLKEGKDYLELDLPEDSPFSAYVPLHHEASRLIASRKIGGVEGKWCIAENHDYQWKRYVYDNLTPVMFVDYTAKEKYTLMLDGNNLFFVSFWDQKNDNLKLTGCKKQFGPHWRADIVAPNSALLRKARTILDENRPKHWFEVGIGEGKIKVSNPKWELKDEFAFIWKSGTWKDGTWKGGWWEGGTWEKGTCKDMLWAKGTWKGGTWESGTWSDGEWAGGTWKGGIWKNGVWRDGKWEDGKWLGGTWKDGTWRYGTWKDGTWINGTWKGGFDKNGKYHEAGDSPDKWDPSNAHWFEVGIGEGKIKVSNPKYSINENDMLIWENGTWKDGTWKGGVWENGTWKGGTWEDGIWNGGDWERGEWKRGSWYNGTWEDGTWHDGIWSSGDWKDGIWKDGTWRYGTWKDGTWINGTWKGGFDKNGKYHEAGDSPDKW